MDLLLHDVRDQRGVLQKRADSTLEPLSETEKDLCRRIFLRLTQPGEGTEDTSVEVAHEALIHTLGHGRQSVYPAEAARQTFGRLTEVPRQKHSLIGGPLELDLIVSEGGSGVQG